MLALPVDTWAVTRPVVLPTVNIAVLLLLHIPPPVRSERVMPAPLCDTDDAPRIDVTVGVGFTVTIAVAIQPEEAMYVIIAVPTVTPVTAPEAVIVATAALLLVQDIPGVVMSDK